MIKGLENFNTKYVHIHSQIFFIELLSFQPLFDIQLEFERKK